jgi:DNA mismatch repair protein MutH
MLISSPQTTTELLVRAEVLSGLSLGEIAKRYQVSTDNLHKGWIGQLIEIALGANAGSKPEPDFMNLGIELKTLPINQQGMPRESTFVCAAPRVLESHWKQSAVYRKLAQVLWIPILTEDSIPLLDRRLSTAILWSPSPEQEAQLAEDWAELTESLCLGKAGNLTARQGKYLQIRPKAANSRVLIQNIDEEGESGWIVPRGFYLRSLFTQQIIQTHYAVME